MIFQRPPVPSRTRRGFTLMEVVVVVTIMGVMIAIPAPAFLRSVEQSKLDVAAGHLRAIWAAQRFYRLENGQYGSLSQLAPANGTGDDLIESSLISGETFYSYTVTLAADGRSFVATAAHPPQSRCSGSISIDESGTLTGAVTYNGQPMSPSMEPGP